MSSAEVLRLLELGAHDLRHPVSALLAYSELLLEPPENLDDEQRSLVEAIRSCGELMLELINDISDMAALESVDLEQEPVDLETMIRLSAGGLRATAEKKGTEIKIVAEPDVVPISADIRWIARALGNVVANAVKHSPADSPVEIRIGRNDDAISVRVTDRGPGVADDEMNTVFNPFAKTRYRAAAKEPGTGLSLAIAKQIVERHGGSIRVENGADEGSRFLVTFPIGPKTPTSGAPAPIAK